MPRKKNPVQLPLIDVARRPGPAAVSAATSPRGRQMIREWQLVLELEGRAGKSLTELAEQKGVSQRTIRRDLAILEEAGFPIVDEMTEEGGRRWRVINWRKEVA